MKNQKHSTNYIDTFIEVADDCKVLKGEIPEIRTDKPTIAAMQYEILSKSPYKYTSDDILFRIFAERKDLIESEYNEARQDFFSKGQACFRASPLTKQYGWGVHSNTEGKIAIIGMETEKYSELVSDINVKKVKAMRSSKK